MSSFKFKTIFLNTTLFFSLSLQANECMNFFRDSDFTQNYQLSGAEFRLLESLAHLELSASDVENIFSKSAILEEVSIKLVEMAQAGIPLKAYYEMKELLLKDVRRRKNTQERNLRKQDQQLKDSKIDGRKAVFHRIEPGSFLMGEVGKQAHTTISKPFELMATHTTQIIWKKIAELIHAKLDGNYDIDSDPSQFKGDTRPVERVPFQKVQLWIEGLNALSQLGEPALIDLIAGHKTGDVYRLPKEAEWEFAIRGRGKYNEAYHFGERESELGDYAWFNSNSNKKTHPVAQKKPLLIDGKEFFDMHGNVSEWTMDLWDGISPPPGGVDPLGDKGAYHVIRGSDWFNLAPALRSSHRDIVVVGVCLNNISFRLVRVLD